MTSPNTTVTTPGDREIHIERVFDAPIDRVWAAHADPALIARWWGRGNRVDIEKFEFERGGHWRFVEHSDGDTHGDTDGHAQTNVLDLCAEDRAVKQQCPAMSRSTPQLSSISATAAPRSSPTVCSTPPRSATA